MARFQDVGGQQTQFMGPDAAGQSRKLAEMLMKQGMQTDGLTHWTQALGKVLQSGVGAVRNDQASADVRDGSMAGNQALAQMLSGGSPDAAMANPYSAPDALKMQVADRNASRSFANQKALLEEKLRMQNADPLYQLKMEKLRADIANPGTSDPAIVQTYKYRQSLPEAERLEFDRVQRAQQWQDLGTSVLNPRTGEQFKKDLAGAEAEKVRGKSEEEKRQNFPRVQASYEQAKLQDKYVVQDIDRALGQAGPWTTGFAGSVGKYVAGSPQSDLSFTLQSIEANLAFDKLEQIKAASPSGGALGQVTERELDLLRATWGSIQQAQSEDQFKYYLGRLKQIKSEYAVLRQRAYEQDLAKYGPAAMGGVDQGAKGGSSAGGQPDRAVNRQTGEIVEWNGSAWEPVQ